MQSIYETYQPDVSNMASLRLNIVFSRRHPLTILITACNVTSSAVVSLFLPVFSVAGNFFLTKIYNPLFQFIHQYSTIEQNI